MEQESVAEKLSPSVDSVDSVPLCWDRRRPGRVKYSNPALIGLLRAQPPTKEDEADTDDHPLAAAKGIVVGLILALPLWAGIGSVFWFFLRR